MEQNEAHDIADARPNIALPQEPPMHPQTAEHYANDARPSEQVPQAPQPTAVQETKKPGFFDKLTSLFKK